MSFRRGLQPSISERAWSDAANEALGTAGAPKWARTSVEEVRLLRELVRPELPRLIGIVASTYQLSDQLSPVEAAFLAMYLGRGLMDDGESFGNGPDAWVEHVRAIQASASVPHAPEGAIRVRRGPDLERELSDQNSPWSRSAHRFLDRLGFPR